ncbi:MAG: putative DNA binding domain-containing protein [Flexilinea sp.]|nr:putative DNA binding domain-containing protein [Flexilinea sp.]
MSSSERMVFEMTDNLLQESNITELKTTLNDKLEKEVVSFLNYREGGDIYFGVDDQGKPVLIEDLDGMQLAIADRIRKNIQPSVLGLFDIVKEKYQGSDIIHVIISSGPEKPYYIRNQGMSEKGCFIRIGTSTQPMTQAMIDDMYARRTHNSLRNIVSPRQKLTFEQLQIYYQTRGLYLNDHFAESLDLLTEDGRYNYIAWLLADNNGASIKVAKYEGVDKTDLIENGEYGYCSLIKAAKSVLDKLEIENRTLTKITSRERIDQRLIEPVALREAVINAFVHNDYSREVTPVFELFSDRLEITSYGGLPIGFSKEDFFSCRSMPRNRELMRVFRDLGLVEQLGSGMGRILRVYDRSIFRITDHYLVATFHYPDESNIHVEKMTIQVNGQSTPQVNGQNTPQVGVDTPQVNGQKTLHVKNSEEIKFEILSFCVEAHSRKEIAEKCGFRDVRYLSSQYLAPLLENGFLRLTIPDKPRSSKQKYQTVLITSDFHKV